MKLLKNGKTLFLALVLASVASGCRSSKPPRIEVCILDGFGGGDCVEADGSQKYRAPSDMKNYWATSEVDEGNYSSWCYDTSVSNVKPAMRFIREEARR